jgi:hypothetical protein
MRRNSFYFFLILSSTKVRKLQLRHIFSEGNICLWLLNIYMSSHVMSDEGGIQSRKKCQP